MQKKLAEKPRSELTPDDIADAMMAFVDSKYSLQPNARSIIYRFFRWFMRNFGGSRRNSLTKRFEAHQNIVESLDEMEKDNNKS